MVNFFTGYCLTPGPRCHKNCKGQCLKKEAEYGPCSSEFVCKWKSIPKEDKPTTGNGPSGLKIFGYCMIAVIIIELVVLVVYCIRVHKRANRLNNEAFGKNFWFLIFGKNFWSSSFCVFWFDFDHLKQQLFDFPQSNLKINKVWVSV